MLKTKELPINILLSSFMITIAIVSLYATHNHKLQVKSSSVFIDEPIVVQRTTSAVKAVTKAEEKEVVIAKVKPATMPTETLPPVLIPPKVISRILPKFPLSALEKDIQGTVILSIYVSSSGLPEKIETKTSSGHEALDRSAISSAMKWKFEPAKRGIQSISSWFEVPIVFRIR